MNPVIPKSPHPPSASTRDPFAWVLVALSAATCVFAGLALVFTRGNPWVMGTLILGVMGLSTALVRVVWHRLQSTPANPRGQRNPVQPFGARPLDSLVSLLRVSRAVGANLSLQELSQVVVDACLDCFNCDEASLMMLEPARKELRVAAFAGHRQPLLVRDARVPLGESVSGMVGLKGQPMILGSDFKPSEFPMFRDKSRSIASAMCVPVQFRGKLFGVLNVSTGNPATPFTEDDLRVLCLLAEHTAIAVAKSRDAARIARIMQRVRRQRLRRDNRSGKAA